MKKSNPDDLFSHTISQYGSVEISTMLKIIEFSVISQYFMKQPSTNKCTNLPKNILSKTFYIRHSEKHLVYS